MREIAIIGIGQTKVHEHWQRSIRDLAGEAISAALKDANREALRQSLAAICSQA